MTKDNKSQVPKGYEDLSCLFSDEYLDHLIKNGLINSKKEGIQFFKEKADFIRECRSRTLALLGLRSK